MTDTPAPQIDFATGEVLTVSLPSGTYQTYVMRWQVTNSLTGEVLSEQSGILLHDWIKTVTPEQLLFVGDQLVAKAALWAAGVR